MLNKITVIAALLISTFVSGQTAPRKYWIQFTDKNNSSFSVSSPELFLSEKSIERRAKFNLGFDDLDLPVNSQYVDAVLATGNCTLHNFSKWFNAITISTEDSTLIETIANLPFVLQVRNVEVYHTSHQMVVNEKRSSATTGSTESRCENVYGPSFRQIDMLHGTLLHALEYTGSGIDIAQFDAGWNMTERLPAFQRLRNEGRIKLTRDFVYHDNVYNLSNHGTFVLSTMAGWMSDSLIGTGPDANYFLFRTEDPLSENLVEEDNWIAAAELCDSLGIDIINSSLGYSEFDDANLNHTYADMDGNTTRCSIAADIAAAKGILVVNSAGNSGDNSWRYITAPSDADSILCVGAVDANRHHAYFSSYGPSSDGDVKPDVVTMGLATVYADLDSTINIGNGTSFSAPILSGMMACLMQAFPNKSNVEIIDAVRRSGHTYLTPTDSLGYGVPDMIRAFSLLSENTSNPKGDLQAVVFPNPCRDYLNVLLLDNMYCDIDYEIYDAVGKRIHENRGVVVSEKNAVVRLDEAVKFLSDGNYTLHLSRAGWHSVLHFTKLK
jgi:serine protease AprX